MMKMIGSNGISKSVILKYLLCKKHVSVEKNAKKQKLELKAFRHQLSNANSNFTQTADEYFIETK